MRILAITYAHPPILRPATMRLLKWYRGLTDLDCILEVVGVEPSSFHGEKDFSLNMLLPARVSFHGVWSPEESFGYRLMRKAEWLFYKSFEPWKSEWVGSAKKVIRSLNLQSYDVIFSCSAPHSCHILGRYVKRISGKPWVAYFSDPWTDNPYARKRSGRVIRYNISLERMVIEGADHILFTSPETRELVMSKYPKELLKKVNVLPHCYVPEWYAMKNPELPLNDNRINIIHAGNFYGERSPLPFLRALRGLDSDESIEELVNVLFVGHVDTGVRSYVENNNMAEYVRFTGVLGYLDSLAAMKRADYLLLIDAPLKNTSQSVFLPSKLIDYIGSGKPVIGLTPASGASARVLRATGNIVVDPDNEGKIRKVLRQVTRRGAETAIRHEVVESFDYHATARNLMEVFHSATGAKNDFTENRTGKNGR